MTMGHGWMSAAKGIATIAQVAADHGLRVSGRRTVCPVCRGERSSTKDRKNRDLAAYITSDGRHWSCLSGAECHKQVGKSVLDFAAACMGASSAKEEAVRDYAASRGWCDAAPGRPVDVRPAPPPVAAPQDKPWLTEDEVASLTRRPVDTCDLALHWLRARGRDPERVLATVTLYAWDPDDRPPVLQGVAGTMRLIAPMYDHRRMVAANLRRVMGTGQSKTTNVRGKRYAGCVFANDAGVAMLQSGELAEGARVWIVEGLPDLLVMADYLGPDSPDVVLGTGSGLWSPEIGQRVPAGTGVHILCDPCPAGDGYARKAAASLAHCRVRCQVTERVPVSGQDDRGRDMRPDLDERWAAVGRDAFDPMRYLGDPVGEAEPEEDSGPALDPDDPGWDGPARDGPPILLRTGPSAYMVLETEGDDYTSMSGREARAALGARWDVQISRENANGQVVAIPIETLFERQGYQLTRTELTFESDRIGLEWTQTHSKRGVLRKALAHHYMEIAPVYDPLCDAFVDLIGGADKQRLRDYIAHFGDLSLSLPILVARGPKGVGKSLLSDMLARLFSRDALTYEAMWRDQGGWNDGAMGTPVVIGDEVTIQTAEIDQLKAAIGPGRIDVRQRWHDTRTLEVHLRIILSQNLKPLFKTYRDTLSSVEALLERMIVLRPDEDGCKAFFEAHNPGKTLTRRWYDGEPGRPYGALCHHLRWMQEPDRRPPVRGRFTVEADERVNREIILEKGGMNESILEFAAAHVLGEARPNPALGLDRPVYYFNNKNRRRNSHIIMNRVGVLQHWQATTGQAHQPAPESVEASLHQIAEEPKARHRTDLAGPHNRVPKGGYAISLAKVLRAAGLDETLTLADVAKMRVEKAQKAQKAQKGQGKQ